MGVSIVQIDNFSTFFVIFYADIIAINSILLLLNLFIRINLEEEFERDMDEINERSSSEESSSLNSSCENMLDNSIETKRKFIE